MPDWDWGYPEDEIDFSPLPEMPDPEWQPPIEVADTFYPDPYENWGGGAGGDGTNGSGDWDVGKVLNVLSQGGSAAASLAKQLGLLKPNGDLDMGAILSLLSLGGMGALQYNNVQGASEQLQNAAKSSMDRSTQMYNDAAALYKPYQAAGLSALEKLTAAGAQPLAAQFVAKGAPSNAASQFRGAMTLSDLAKRK